MELGELRVVSSVERYRQVASPPGLSIRVFELAFATSKGTYYDLTQRIEQELVPSKIMYGLCHVFSKHTSAGLWVNELEEGIPIDLDSTLSRFAPEDAIYKHDLEMHRSPGIDMGREPKNGYSHQRSLLFRPNVCVPVVDGALALGTYQRVLFFELDGSRERNVLFQYSGHAKSSD